MWAWSPSSEDYKYMCFTLVTLSSFTACQELLSHCREPSSKGKSMERDRDRRKEKENIFGAVCCRSKTWQSHDQRHLIILELHCSFNPSERTIFYWEGAGWIWDWVCVWGGNVRVVNSARNAVTICWKRSLLNVVWQLWGSRRRRQHKASLCAVRMEAELMGVETQMCHKSLSTQHWIVLLFFLGGCWGSWLVECDQTALYYIWHRETEGELRSVWVDISLSWAASPKYALRPYN